mmetsp:Transcript_41659/g.107849  ORF Transcript_41659/g.107849 Transcript_41659/m.107849 type:complete len:401 (+) Transcript_41659:316-1518(+)
MSQPAVRNQKRGLEGCVPDSIMHALEHSKRNHRPVPMLRSETRKARPVESPARSSALQSDVAAFLSMATPSQPAQGRRVASSSPDRGRDSRHTYSTGRASPPRPRKQEALSEPVRNVHKSRQRMMHKMQESYAASERMQRKLEQQDFMQEAMQGIATVMSVDASSEPNSNERSVGSAAPFRGRRRVGRELSPQKSKSFAERAMGEPQDSIDTFLALSSVSPVPGGQRIVSDLSGELGDSMKRHSAPAMPPPPPPDANAGRGEIYGVPAFLPSEYSYVAGGMEGDLEERIGQYGGLIPTLYTMDKLDASAFLAKRKTVVQPANRYSIKVTTRDSKVTGAGFRRAASSKAKEYVPSSTYAERPHLESMVTVPPTEDPAAMRAAAGVVPGRMVQQEGALTYAV